MTDSPLSILITGTSSGFGKRTAHTLARRGHRVFASMRDIDSKNAEAAEAMRRWTADENVDLQVVELDITDQATIDKAVQRVLASAGRIDVVVNNAASATAGLLEAFSLDEVRASFETVAFGALRVDKAVLPTMREQGSGLLVHVSSSMGRIILPFVSPYSAGKAALEAFAEELSFELAPLGIESVIVEPGGYPTEGATNGSGIVFPAEQGIAAQYGAMGSAPQEMFHGIGEVFSRPDAPNPQEVAEAIAELIDRPAGERRCAPWWEPWSPPAYVSSTRSTTRADASCSARSGWREPIDRTPGRSHASPRGPLANEHRSHNVPPG